MVTDMLRRHAATLAAIGLALAVTAAPAQATAQSAQVPIFLEVRGDNNQKLSGMYGWVEFNDGNTYTYQIWLCRESSYSAATGNVLINESSVNRTTYSVNYGNTDIPQCRYPASLFGKTDYVGSTVRNVTFHLTGVNFNGQNQATWKSAATTYDNPFN